MPVRSHRNRRIRHLFVAVVTASVFGGVAFGVMIPSQASEIPASAAAGLLAPGTISDVPTTATRTALPPPGPGSPSPCPTSMIYTAQPISPFIDTVAPTVPCRLTAVNNGIPTQLILSWVASIDNVGVAAYVVSNLHQGIVTTTTTAGNVTSVTLTVNPNVQNTITVVARDAAGNVSAPTGPLVYGQDPATTSPVDTQPPTVPILTLLVATTGNMLNWSASTDNVGVTAYVLLDMAGDVIMQRVLPPTASTYPAGSANGEQHTYWIHARDAAGNLSPSSNRVSVGVPPTCPVPGPCPPRTTTPPPDSSTCKVTYTIGSQWQGNFVADVRITNTGTTAINGWTLRFTFANGQTIEQLWSGSLVQTPPNEAVTNLNWNNLIAVNQSVNFGFLGKWSGTNAKPSAFSLNTKSCAIG